MPPTQACDHPCYDLAKGERLLKDIYESLRAGPKWEKTLFLIMYDDAGVPYTRLLAPRSFAHPYPISRCVPRSVLRYTPPNLRYPPSHTSSHTTHYTVLLEP